VLDQIHIRNYKNLRDLALDLRAFNVLIGPNNAGKSNVFRPLSSPVSPVLRK
jgi:AAA15 family ATPase/GTPase